MRAFALLVALAACKHATATAPSSAPSSSRAFIASIEVCKTTEADVRARLGPPTRDGRLGDARILIERSSAA